MLQNHVRVQQTKLIWHYYSDHILKVKYKCVNSPLLCWLSPCRWASAWWCVHTGRCSCPSHHREEDRDQQCQHHKDSSMPSGTSFDQACKNIINTNNAVGPQTIISSLSIFYLSNHRRQNARVPKFWFMTLSNDLALGIRRGTWPTSKFFM